MNRKIDYESAFLKKQKENIEHLRKNIHNPEYVRKMKKFAENNFISFHEVVNKALSDNLFSLQFVKNAKKQSIHEEVAAKFICANENISDFQVLPKSGKNALYLYKGKIIDNMSYWVTDEYSKSIDFYWNVKVGNKVLDFYASHKYTQERGGGQDHQLIEIDHFLANAKKNKDENKFFIGICDGKYYNETNKKNKISKLERLRTKYKGHNNVIAVNSNEIDILISNIIKVQKKLIKKEKVKIGVN